MDIALMSVLMNQSAVQNAASISVVKLAMNSSTEMATTQISDIMNNNMAIDTSKGTNIDVRA
ncbi:hypothetical protein CDLVIII_4998 [Clostridium sp. DL-VIII]|uniref:putative motility protein n=1 Tax=Clostridium sp. DL-VIII TaxID=641107 RepID=UPI00023B062A|nr:YjfB family protein [Clostridium sp. DL-VIII]EHJ01489.1 hypothetical protein CDLVIII_4998 [Clostridium sp. DL-VIII]